MGVIASFLTVVGLLWKMFLKEIWKKHIEAQKAKLRSEHDSLWQKHKQELIEVLDSQSETINQIKFKLFPNGGTSIDDKLEVSLKDNRDIKTSLVELRSGQRNTWEIMDVAVWISNDLGQTVYVNKPYCGLVGCTYEDAIGLSWLGLISEVDRKRVREAWKDSIDTISDFDEFYSFERPDGLYQKVNGIAIHNRDKETGKLISSMGRLIKTAEPSNEP